MILALDISLSNTGIAVFNDSGECLSLISIDTKKDEGHPKKLKHIERQLKIIKKKYKPSMIVMEESFTRFNASTHAIYKVRGVVELVFHNIKQVFYHATTVRKEVLGRGNAKKEDVQEFILNNYKKIEFKNNDESDAFAVGVCYFKKMGVL